MMLKILSKYNIDSFAFIDAKNCKVGNLRLHSTLPEECNVIFMLFPYFSGNCDKKISAYGAVHDYHFFAKELFSDLENYFLENYPESFTKGYADHSPFLECEGAAAAGLGVLGDNSLLITKKYSSYVFIGELITTVSREELISLGIPEGDGNIDTCIHCGACKSACPSKCAGGTDRSNCISSVTQKKGALTYDEIQIIKNGGSIWGCDICQESCPYTKKAKEENTIYTPIEFFRRSYLGIDPEKKIPLMGKDDFERYPFAWRKRATIERNINLLFHGEKDNG